MKSWRHPWPWGLALALLALGITDAFDGFTPDPNDPNAFIYEATVWGQGSDPNAPNTYYAQFYLGLHGIECDCCNSGASGMFCAADIDGSGDCMVGLADLATLLADYGATGGAYPGDLEGGDGDVDLADLATLLAQYGDDCN